MVTWGSLNKKKTTTEIRHPTKKRGTYGKGRSSRTNQNKLRQLTKFYEGLVWRSQELKQSKKYPNKTKYFCDRFKTLDSFVKHYPLKKLSEKR